MWQDLMGANGVMAAVYYLSKQIEESLAKTIRQPVEFEPVPQGIPRSDRQLIKTGGTRFHASRPGGEKMPRPF
jgi:hypothetical protein